VEVAEDARDALDLTRTQSFDVVVSDMKMEKETSGLKLLKDFKDINPQTQVILMSAYSSIDTAVEAVRAGAFDYVAKPFDVREVMATVDRALAVAAEASEPAASTTAPSPLPSGLVGRTPEMLAVYKQVALAADAMTPVLVVGESGTGKELVARAIHDYGRGRSKPFVAVNCGALAENLLESELFGHVRGAFTGAVVDKRGLFEQASGGTVFLDEIGETSPSLQVKLLRVLQESEVRPVGGSRDVKVSGRVVAATNRNLEEEVAEKRFRQDLYYRLSAFVVPVPPLRERKDDVPLLAAQFLRNACFRARKEVQIADDAIQALQRHAWPGNVRELENAVERLVLGARGSAITAEEAEEALKAAPGLSVGTGGAFADLPTLDELEKRYLLHVVEVAEGNRTKAAKIMGIDRRTLYRMAARFGVPLAGGETEEGEGG
jgi:DNA-binding NtrC family response regulator